MAKIDYTPLGKAVERLKEGLAALGHEPANTLYRDAVIQRFEIAYGLCAGMLERHLTQAAPVSPDYKMSFPTLVRTACEMGLLRSGWDQWQGFREARNRTSHVYNEEIARQVVECIPAFALEAEALYGNLQQAAERDDH